MIGACSESQVVRSMPSRVVLWTTKAGRVGELALPATMNGRLRTGADKGNPTV